MPSLGADMEAGTLAAWRVGPSDAVVRGQVVADVETDKGIIEVEIWQDGVIDEIRVQPGTRVPVGTVLATLRGGVETAAAAPAAGPAGSAPRQAVSPAARRRARELGLDPAGAGGTGPHGSVTLADVERLAASGAVPAAPVAARAAGMRRAVAAAMSRSKREIPHYYLAMDVDVSRALEWLEQENARRVADQRLLPAALFVRAVALACRDVPELNGLHVDGELRVAPRVNVGWAISLRGGGLVAPAILDADGMGPDAIMSALSGLVARARSGGLRSSEMSEATITVSSLGEQGVEALWGVIYPPQVALVGIGTITERPWADGGAVVSRPVVTITLSADHRATDGHRGSRFLASVRRHLGEVPPS
jgi:pyruvate dehydrogenase E2 component (dihydrolipoamide acetyltransferase)